LSLVGGIWLNGSVWVNERTPFGEFLKPSLKWTLAGNEETAGGMPASTMALISLIAAVAGVLAAVPFFRSGVFARGWRPTWWVRAVDARFGYDWLVHFIFVDVGEVIAGLTSAFVDQLVIDGIVNGTAKLVGWSAQRMRGLQTGFVRNYALLILTGAVFV